VSLGQSEKRTDNLGKRFRNVLLYPFAQRCTISRYYPFGWNHAVFFWVFLILVVTNIYTILNGLFPNVIALSKLPNGLQYTLNVVFDIAWVIALASIIVSLIRRVWLRPRYTLPMSPDAAITMSLFVMLMIGYYGIHASQIAQGSDEAALYLPISNILADSIFSGANAAVTNIFWWIHATALMIFMVYMAYTKHTHMLASIPNVFFGSIARINTLPMIDFANAKSLGVGQIDQFRWKDLLDAFACTECGRCMDNCPATATQKPLDPRSIIHDIKYNVARNGQLLLKKKEAVLPLIGHNNDGTISEDALWACTTCGACMEMCPVSIEHIPKIVGMRRYLVQEKSQFPEELGKLFENIKQRSNPWGLPPPERAKWAMPLRGKPFIPNKTEYLFYVGCAGAFDARARQTTLAIARILDAAGLSWGILGMQEKCCGDSVRRLGHEFNYDRMVKENLKLFDDKGIKKIITACPHCFNTLKNDYAQYGAKLEVMHYSELVGDLMQQGKLQLNNNTTLGKVVFHDSCYLGRYNGIYESPRETLAALNGTAPIEMDRNHDRSFCCGAGGGRMWVEEKIGKHINIERVEEALKKDPDIICACCPYCITMFEDGLKDKKTGEKVKVMDLAEMVAGALKENKPAGAVPAVNNPRA